MESRQAVAQQFVSILGRRATPEELDHFGKFIDQGHLDPTEIGQVLQSSPEYQNTLLKQQGQQYGDMLAQGDEAQLGRANSQITAQLARAGRSGSSALESGLAQAAGGLAQQRQSALAAFYGRGLQQNAGLGQQMGAGALSRGYGLRDEARQRNYQIEDYYRQQNDYNNYQNAHSGWNAITPEFALTQGVKALGAIGSGAAAGFMMSDMAAKENIERVGSVGPLNVYAFDYRKDMGFPLPAGRQVGFMAQEVEKVFPEAIGSHRGLKTVNYGYLAGVL
jgi:hypothetical protein